MCSVYIKVKTRRIAVAYVYSYPSDKEAGDCKPTQVVSQQCEGHANAWRF